MACKNGFILTKNVTGADGTITEEKNCVSKCPRGYYPQIGFDVRGLLIQSFCNGKNCCH